MTEFVQKIALLYVDGRRAEQVQDNIDDEQCIATEEHPNAIGVDYASYRKNIAKYLRANLDLSAGYGVLNAEANKYMLKLLATGIHRNTITRWLAKYEGFTGTLHLVTAPRR